MSTPTAKHIPSLAVLGLAAAIGCASAPVSAGEHALPTTASEQAALHQKAAEQTEGLLTLQKQWAQAQGSARSSALEKLIAKAQERKAFLQDLMDSNPAAALRVMIPEDRQLGMPD
ncbi:MAG: hypothetical protein GYB21_16170, partial [Oceanospirillales bacterium]|nr:hypothetical protein [Oceanospirillales bacterium]